MTFVEMLRLPRAFARPTDMCETAAFEAASAAHRHRKQNGEGTQLTNQNTVPQQHLTCCKMEAQERGREEGREVPHAHAATGPSAEAGLKVATEAMLICSSSSSRSSEWRS
jgi:hypothetical protein